VTRSTAIATRFRAPLVVSLPHGAKAATAP
jgi:hypothetical protein